MQLFLEVHYTWGNHDLYIFPTLPNFCDCEVCLFVRTRTADSVEEIRRYHDDNCSNPNVCYWWETSTIINTIRLAITLHAFTIVFNSINFHELLNIRILFLCSKSVSVCVLTIFLLFINLFFPIQQCQCYNYKCNEWSNHHFQVVKFGLLAEPLGKIELQTCTAYLLEYWRFSSL